MRTRGRIWAGTLLLAVLSQFAGPLSGVASAFVGPVWLPVSQAEPEVEQAEPGDGPSEAASPEAAPSEDGPAPEAGEEPVPDEAAEEPDAPGVAAADDGCAEGDAPTDVAVCVTDFASCAPAAGADPAAVTCATAAAGDIQEEAGGLVPSEDPPCEEAGEPDSKLACVLDEVRKQGCSGQPTDPQCVAVDLVIECVEAPACVAERVVAPAAEQICGALPPAQDETSGECEDELEACAAASSEACGKALDYLRGRLEKAACAPGAPACAPVVVLNDLLDCARGAADEAALCGFEAVWTGATPSLCDRVGDDECEDRLDDCEDPSQAGCERAAEYLQERLDATACGQEDAPCVARKAVESCRDAVAAGQQDAPARCDGAVYTAVINVVCEAGVVTGDCPPEPTPSLRGCMTWNGTEPKPNARCARDIVIEAACEMVEDCVLQEDPVAALIAAGDDCSEPGTTPPACAEGLRQVVLGALCAQPETCVEGLEECTDPAVAACPAEAVWDEVCADESTSCPPELKGLRQCIGAPASCATPAFLQPWIADACVRRASASPACPVELLVQPPTTVATPDGGSQTVPAGFENGSTAFPYRTIKAALTALSTASSATIPSVKGPVRVAAGGTYTENITVPSFPAGVDASIVGTGNVTLTSSGATLTLPPTHRLAIKRPLLITGSPAITGPTVTTTVTIDRSRMYVGHGAGIEVSFASSGAKLPEQVHYELLVEGPGVSKSALKVQTWNGAAWTDLALTDAGSGMIARLYSSDATAVPSLVSGSASVRVVGTSTMGLTITGRLIGVMTQVVYASETLPYIEVAEVPDAPVPPVATPRTEADDAPPTVRLSGEDRAATAAAVSRSAFPDGADAVFVATGASYADALAGGPAAAKSGSPVVLVERDRVPEATRAELARLAPEQVRLLGGTGAISAEVEEELAATGADVSRLRGDSRYTTAAAVSAAHFAPGVPVVYIASGEGFADALSGGAAAAALGGPVLLVQPDAVPSATEQELQRLSPGRIVVLGGKQAVSDTVEAQLRASGTDVRRVSGATRYATSAAVSRDAFTGTQDTVFVATGATFPDALAGVPAAGALKAPLMLVETDRLPAEVAAELDRLRPKRIVILGGQNSVSQRLERELRSYQIP